MSQKYIVIKMRLIQKEGIEMKNRNKTLTSLAAASMVLTQVGQMSVFAKEEPIKNLSDTEEVSVEKTQKELLEEQIKNTLDNVLFLFFISIPSF